MGIPGISADGTEVVASGASGFFSFQLGGGPNAIGPKAVQGIGPQASGPRLSPDGRWLVYATAESGGGLYVQPFPGPGPRRQIAPGPAISPLWRRDGKEILYRSADTLMSVAVEWSGTLAFVTPRKLFDVRVPAGALNTSLPLAVSHDGSRIFWAQGVEQPDSNVIHVKTGAFDRLH
jgi:hypothetical protein